MAEEVKGKRGRKPGVTKTVTTIKDPSLGNYHIEIMEKHQFNIMEKGKEHPIAYCTSLEGALKNICKQTLFNTDETMTIKEYIKQFKDEFDKIHEALAM